MGTNNLAKLEAEIKRMKYEIISEIWPEKYPRRNSFANKQKWKTLIIILILLLATVFSGMYVISW